MACEYPVQATYEAMLLALKVSPRDAQRAARKFTTKRQEKANLPLDVMAERAYRFFEKTHSVDLNPFDSQLRFYLEKLGDYGTMAYMLADDSVNEMNGILGMDEKIVTPADLLHPNPKTPSRLLFVGAYEISRQLGLQNSLGEALAGATYAVTGGGISYQDGFAKLVEPLLEMSDRLEQFPNKEWFALEILPPIRQKVAKYFQ